MITFVGREFGRWTVVGWAGRDDKREALWLCECRCDHRGVRRRAVPQSKLLRGSSRSCGCLRAETAAANACASTPLKPRRDLHQVVQAMKAETRRRAARRAA